MTAQRDAMDPLIEAFEARAEDWFHGNHESIRAFPDPDWLAAVALAALRAVGGDRIALVWTREPCPNNLSHAIGFVVGQRDCPDCHGSGFTEAPTLHRLEQLTDVRDYAVFRLAAVEAPVAPKGDAT